MHNGNREGVLDFAELLLRCFELLSKNEILREHYRGRFKHILVDEFQDTSRCNTSGSNCWRARTIPFSVSATTISLSTPSAAARAGNMLDFEKDFHVEKVIKLEQNYRSQGNILDAGQCADPPQPRPARQEPVDGARQRRAAAAVRGDDRPGGSGYILDEVKQLKNESAALSEIALPVPFQRPVTGA